MAGPREPVDDRLTAAAEAAGRWAMHDPDPVTRGHVDRLVDAEDPALIDLFDGRVAFGTAGLRAAVGPGPNRMNALVVRQTTVGVVEWLRRRIDEPVVYIGYDARRDSSAFARHAAAAVVAAGGRAVLADAAVPTPVVAHALLANRASAAVVVTASHNPPGDNGYKLYVDDGRQIVPPVEHEIAAAIDAVVAGWSSHGPGVDDAYAGLGPDAISEIDAERWIAAHRGDAVEAARRLGGGIAAPVADAPVLVYTPLHGVGGAPTLAAFEEAGLRAPVVVESQFAPDGSFPTVVFPNPEEPGALDEAIATAEQVGALAVIAQDPDADRLALAVRGRHGAPITALTGNELGVLLGDHLLRVAGPAASEALVARSVVSSRMLDAIAAHHGAACAVTLTGFKWLARAADDFPERRWLFGFEEALGYCIGTHVRDKDGITAALVAAHLLAELDRSGSTIWDRLDELAATVGVYESRPVTVRFDADPDRIDAVVADWTDHPPERLGPTVVAHAGPIGGGELPATDGVELLGTDDTRVIVRPSGTEPKVKVYLEVFVSIEGRDVDEARREARARLDAVAAAVEERLEVG